MSDRGVEVAELLLRLGGGDLDEVVVVEKLRLDLGVVGFGLATLLHERLPMGGQRPVKRRDRGEEALLEVGEQEPRPRPARRGFPVVVEHRGELQLRRVRRQPADDDRLDDAFGERVSETSQVLLEPADHDRLQLLRLDVDAAGEPLRVEDLEQRREGVGMAVVRRRRQEEPMLEQGRDVADVPGELTFDGPDRSRRRRGVVGLVENEQRAWPERREKVAKPSRVGLVGEDAVRDDETGAHAPRVRREASRPPRLQQVFPIDDGEVEAELLRQLVLPLEQHRRRRGDDDHLDAAPEQHLADDQAGLDRLAEADVVGDQQVDAREIERLRQRQELVGIQPDAGAKRRLEQLPVRRGGGAPFGRAKVGAETPGFLERLRQQRRPVVWVQHARVELGRERDLQGLALGIVFTGDEIEPAHRPEGLRRLDDPGFPTDRNEVADLRNGDGCALEHFYPRPPSFAQRAACSITTCFAGCYSKWPSLGRAILRSSNRTSWLEAEMTTALWSLNPASRGKWSY